MKAKEVTAGLAESNGSLLPGLWRDPLHVTCGLTACIPRDQLRAQRSVTSIGKLYLFILHKTVFWTVYFGCFYRLCALFWSRLHNFGLFISANCVHIFGLPISRLYTLFWSHLHNFGMFVLLVYQLILVLQMAPFAVPASRHKIARTARRYYYYSNFFI